MLLETSVNIFEMPLRSASASQTVRYRSIVVTIPLDTPILTIDHEELWQPAWGVRTGALLESSKGYALLTCGE